MWLYQYLAVLGQYVLALILNPVVFIRGKGCWDIRISSIIVGVVVALINVIITIAILDSDKEFTVLLIGAVHITNITTTEDVAILTCQLLGCTYCAAMHMYLSLSKDITVGIECTTITKVVIASTTTKDIAMYLSFEPGTSAVHTTWSPLRQS